MELENNLDFYENLRRAVQGYVTSVKIANAELPETILACPTCKSSEKLNTSLTGHGVCGICGEEYELSQLLSTRPKKEAESE
jgi:transcription initiation factor IIE alpha subunit